MTSEAADRVFLVACVSEKQNVAAPAKDLNASDWFRKARAFVEATGCPWFILSAEYGLVHPDQVIEPYERTLNRMTVQERRDWARRVQEQMAERMPDAGEIVVIAGERYRGLLMDYLRTRGDRVSVPMEGMGIGEQLQWLGTANSGEPLPSASASAEQPVAAARGTLDRIARRLMDLNGRIDCEVFFPTLEEGATEFVLRDAYAFLLATCLDRGTKSEIIWTIPWWLQQRWGHFDPARVRRMSRDDLLEALTAMPRHPCYLSDAPVTIEELTGIVADEHDGDARSLWRGRTAREFRETLQRVRGVGPNIGSMAVQLVELAFPSELVDSETGTRDIKADVHTKRVLYRLGIASDGSEQAALAAARRLRPAYPGELDGPIWYIGRTWCHPSEPECSACFVADLCARRGVGTSSDTHAPPVAVPAEPGHSAKRKRGRPGGKYARLEQYLAQRGTDAKGLSLSFRELEDVLGFALPASARQYRAWWSNTGAAGMHSHATAWLRAGFRVGSVDIQDERVEFVRSANDKKSECTNR